jgi:hypothetical protein
VRTSRIVTAGAVLAVTAGAVALSPVAQAKAAEISGPSTRHSTRVSVSPVPHRAHMGSYAASRFASAAAKLPSGLAGQLRRQLGITPEQFLADGQAGADAGQVIASLRADGVTVFGAKLNGTALTVTVRDAAGAAAAEADGATAVIGGAQPAATVQAKAVSSPADGTSALLGGDLWFYLTDSKTGEGVVCSTGFNGYDKNTGAKEFLTAGHCGDYKDTGEPAPADGIVYAATDTDPVTLDAGIPIPALDPGSQVPALGSLDQSSFHFGGGEDSGVVDVTDTEAKPAPDVNTWNSTDTNIDAHVENSGKTVPVLGAAAAVNGEPVCHSGERTGWQCGTVDNPKNAPYTIAAVQGATVSQTVTVDGFETSVCLLPGDSGGSFVSGEYAVGVASAGTFTPKSSSGAGDNTCSSAGGTSIAYPMAATAAAAASGEESAALSEPDFELAVSVPALVVSAATAAATTGNGTISGGFSGPVATGTPVSLSLDGHPKVATTANSAGDWSFSLAGLTAGVHSYTVTAGSGHSTASKSGTLTIGQVAVSGTPQVGKTMTASLTGVPSGGTVTYQWKQNGVAVHAGQTYVVAGGVGQTLTATATVTAGGFPVSVTSATTAAIAAGSFSSINPPGISGTVRVASKVTASTGTWSVTGPTFTYQWLANGKAVGGATASSYTIPASLAGTKLSVTVTAHKSGYNNAARTSAASSVAAGILTLKVKPKLSGTPQVGKTLSVTTGTWSPVPTIKVQWYMNGKLVGHATGTSLKLSTVLKGQIISVTVIGSKAGYGTVGIRLTESTKVAA